MKIIKTYILKDRTLQQLIQFNVKSSFYLNSNGNLEKPINSNNTDNLEDVHLTMAIPKSEEFATLWRTSELHVKNKDTSAAIGPLGLLGFGLTTFLLNLGNAGVFDMAPLS